MAFGAWDATNATLGRHPERARGGHGASGRAVKGSLREAKSVKGSLTDRRLVVRGTLTESEFLRVALT